MDCSIYSTRHAQLCVPMGLRVSTCTLICICMYLFFPPRPRKQKTRQKRSVLFTWFMYAMCTCICICTLLCLNIMNIRSPLGLAYMHTWYSAEIKKIFIENEKSDDWREEESWQTEEKQHIHQCYQHCKKRDKEMSTQSHLCMHARMHTLCIHTHIRSLADYFLT